MVPLELHVWGPALGLASIDAECLAAIAYFRNALPDSRWHLIPSSDPSLNPHHRLPSLHHDGVWVSGYRQIVDHLAPLADLDRHLTADHQAHVAGLSAFLSDHASSLVDLSLYVSAANWSATTRPAYSAILPFPLTWTLPPLIRAEAISRVHHLGLAELDPDLASSPGHFRSLNVGRDALPEALRKRVPITTTTTVRHEMTPEQATAIRLSALVNDCLSVLERLLESSTSSHFLPHSEASVSSLDCLAYGYLALMLKPDVPRAFLRDWFLARGPRLTEFIDVMTPTELPWLTPEPSHRTLIGYGVRFFDSVIRNIPTLGDLYADEVRLRARRGIRGLDRRMLTLVAGLTAAGLAVGCAFHAYRSLQPFGAASQVWRCGRAGTKLSRVHAARAGRGGALESGVD
ncbi:hypothetical protein XA68_16518 [Ophiocordyceps unilateralis]|uniref:Mitochondrial outer membrane transport complex Sam37/metaxin N-terminal domain-containing protein n=1 Tax=Ophiocordyceps unilateralis TaxID=268505 RepID=A0A2A9P6H1_OPHUN|nr:hypothetical protein XA68_16518 [Ophiocordyceps unilateralis]